MTDRDQKPAPQVVTSYASGVAQRTAARDEARRANPVFPNLGQAAVAHRADEGPRTLAEHAVAQRADGVSPVPDTRSLRPETVDGLRQLHAAQAEAQAKKAAEEPTAPKEEPSKGEAVSLEDEQFAEALAEAQKDVIQNKFERDAVAKRVKEIDLAQGLVSGEFTQIVPIVPDKLNVTYRCLCSGENNEIRLMLIDELEKDGRQGAIAETLLGFYQMVATILSINDTAYARHMVPDGAMGKMTFQREIFQQKVHMFMAFPMPLISALGTHSAWFEQRVRQLFSTTDALKNG